MLSLLTILTIFSMPGSSSLKTTERHIVDDFHTAEGFHITPSLPPELRGLAPTNFTVVNATGEETKEEGSHPSRVGI